MDLVVLVSLPALPRILPFAQALSQEANTTDVQIKWKDL